MKIYISGKISGTDLTKTRKRFAAVAKAIQKSTSAATHKRMRLRDNKFTEEDFQRIHDFYLEKLRNIEKL